MVLDSFRRLPVSDTRHAEALGAYLRRAVDARLERAGSEDGDRSLTTGFRPAIVPADGIGQGDAAIGPLDDRYRAALRRLAREDRELVVARLELGFNYDQIALMTRRPSPGAARVAVSRAVLRLAESMRDA